jgi:thiol-disulfide isomerase/thioredoxin
MPINPIDFRDLQGKLKVTGKTLLNYLAPDVGNVYVVAVTRDGCPACEKQKPKLDELSERMAQEHNNSVVFTRVRVAYSESFKEESQRSKDVLGHYFYPTNMVLIRTPDRGSIATYTSVAPNMHELEKNIEKALGIAAEFNK